MRKLILGMACAATALTAPAGVPAVAGVPAGSTAEASPVSTQPLAANEVLLEISAVGTATTRATLATMTVVATGRGTTEAEARRAHARQADRIIAAARRARVAAEDIDVGEPMQDASDDLTMEWGSGETGDESMADASAADAAPDAGLETANAAAEAALQAAEAAADAAQSVEHGTAFSSAIDLRLRDSDRIDAVRAALQQAGAENLSDPTYEAGDQSAARRQARAQALAAARADADAYSATLGLRVVRIVRVTERVGMDLSSLMMMGANSAMANLFGPQGQAQGPDIPTFVMVGVDFALAPQ